MQTLIEIARKKGTYLEFELESVVASIVDVGSSWGRAVREPSVLLVFGHVLNGEVV